MPSGPRAAWREGKDGLVVQVRLTPKSARDEVRGLEAFGEDLRLAVAVRAVPDKGAANAALVRCLAEWLEVPRSSVELSSGATSRNKALTVRGDAPMLASRLKARLERD